MNTKRLLSGLSAVAFLGVIAVLMTPPSHSAPSVATPSAPCFNCTADKIMVAPRTGDPQVDQANLDRAIAMAQWKNENDPKTKAWRAKMDAQDRAWRGTKIGTKQSETDEATIALHDAVSRVFAVDPPAPQTRTNAIQSHIAGHGFTCVGYYGTIESVTSNDNGWIAVIKVSPHLVGRGIPFTTHAALEEWQIGKDGSLTNLSCKADPKKGLVMID